MAFAFTLDTKIPLRDAHGKIGPLFIAIGTFTNGGADTGGEIDTESDLVLFASASSDTGLLGLQVAINSATDGAVTITTTADYDGVWMAICKGYAV